MLIRSAHPEDRVKVLSASSDDTRRLFIRIGELRIDLDTRRVYIGEADLHLVRTEYAILAELALEENQPVHF